MVCALLKQQDEYEYVLEGGERAAHDFLRRLDYSLELLSVCLSAVEGYHQLLVDVVLVLRKFRRCWTFSV